jgi:hypothetical protein
MKIFRPLLSFALCTMLAFATGTPACGEDKPKRLTVSDYFVMLPDGSLETPAVQWLRFLRQPKCGVEDTVNGYLSCVGDGAQPEFQVALFRFRDDRPLLAVCQAQGDEGGMDSVRLDFYQLNGQGQMVKAPRSIFPVKDKPNAHSYALPRKGRTVLVRSAGSGKVLQKFTWNGERFVEEK